jgi:hypothetical protein
MAIHPTHSTGDNFNHYFKKQIQEKENRAIVHFEIAFSNFLKD